MKKKLSVLVTAAVLSFTAVFAVACAEDVKLPHASDKQYTVTYYYNYDGSPNNGIYKTEKVDENTAASKPTKPERANYTFDTWTSDVAGKTTYVFSTLVTGDLKLYAQWSPSGEAATLTGITATVSKTYKVGDTFSKNDITVTARYTDNTEKTVTDFMYDEPDMKTAGKKQITVTHKGKTTTVEITVDPKQEVERTLTGIEIATQPSKKAYLVGEELDLTDMVVKAVYSNGDEAELKDSDYEVSGYKKTELGEQEITVTYDNKTAKFTVTVNAATVVRIEITSAPTVTEYIEGEEIDLEGMVVTAYYNNGTSKEVTDYTHNYNAAKIGEQTVTVTYDGDKTATFTVTVSAAELTGIKVVTKPTKIDYEVGEELDLNGMVVTASYNNGAKKDVTKDCTATGFVSNTAGTYTVLIGYKGFSDNFKVTVTQVTYTVKFVTNVDGITATSQTVNKNGNAKTPTLNKEREGYRLLGWYESGSETAYKFATTPVTKDITLTARWQAIDYTITYHIDGVIDEEAVEASLSGEKTAYNIETDSFTLVKPTVTTAGVKFLRWHKGSATGAAISQIARGTTGNIEVYAEYTKNDTVTFTFDFNYDGSTAEEHDVVSGLAVTQIDDPTRLGYSFGGWYNEAACTTAYDFDKPVTSDLSEADRTVYAKWTPKTIGVILDADNGSQTETVDVAFDQAITTPTAPTKLGHKFLGWFRLDGTTKWDFVDKLCDVLTRESLTLTAHWEAEKYDVVFKLENGENDITVEDVTFGTAIPAEKMPANPEKLGHDFVGWFNGENKWLATSKLTTEGLTLTAHWEANEYDVTFNFNGGKTSDNKTSATKQITFGNKVTALSSVPTQKGHTLDGWYTDDGDLWNFDSDTLQTEGLTLTAHWTANDVTVKFIDDDGAVIKTTTVKYGEKITDAPDDPTKTGYTFLHWHKLDRDTVWDLEENSVEQEPTLTLEAHWKADTYTVQFVTGDKADDIDDDEYTYNEVYILPSSSDVNVTEKGYSFMGWYDNPEYSGNAYTEIGVGAVGNKIFYARIEKNSTVDFTFDLNYEGAKNVVDKVIQGTPATTRTVSRDGYTFLGWFTARKGGDEYDFTQDVMSATTVYAQWEVKSYNVTFDAQNGTAPEVVKFTSQQNITAIAVPVKEGHTFVHWYVLNGDEDAAYEFGDKPTKNISLVAKWKLTEYTVTFNYNYADKTAERQVEYGKKIESKPNDPTRTDGYSFKGWFKEVGLDNAWNFETDTVSGDVTLYAKWEINKYTVTFNLDGGYGVVADQTIEHGKKVAAPTATLTKEGYHLTGWKLITGAAWNFGTDTVTKDMTLVANWEINTYTVTFDANGGTDVASQTIEHNGNIDKTAITTARDGWQFDHWEADGVVFDLDTGITAPVALTAVWTRTGGTGTFLHIRTNSQGAWSDLSGVTEHDGDYGTEWKAVGVKLQVGSQFLVVTYADGGDNWLHANADGFRQYTYDDIVTIEVDGDNFKVTALNDDYKNVSWTLYIKLDGKGISLEIPRNADEPRSTNGTGTLTFGAAPEDAIYVAGTFTDGFKYHKDWSTQSTAITVKNDNGVYTFRGVYLKKNDAFKIVDKGKWYGGNLKSEGVTVAESTGDMMLVMIENGLYDIIYNSVAKTVKVVPYTPPTVATVTVTPPTKTTYWQGEPFNAADMAVSYTDTDGKTFTADEYDISDTATTALGTKTITVTVGTETATFTITVNELKVTFDSDGGTSVAAQSLSYGEKAKAPTTAPAKTGHDFGGWFVGETEYNFATAVTAPVTLTAKWTVHEYTVTFKNDDTVLATVQVPYNTAIPTDEIPTATKTGYDFNGWKNGNDNYTLSDKVTKDLELTADFTIQSYQVTLDYNDGETGTVTQNINYNGTVTKPSAASTTRTGYEFLGWFKDGQDTAYDFTTKVTEPITLTAQWEAIEYAITYHLEGNIGGEAVTATLSGEKTKYTIETATFALVKPTVTTAGVKFLNWHKGSASGTVISQIAKGTTGNIDVYAEYTQNATVKFTFDLNYEGATDEEQDVVSGLTASAIDDPIREGYTFGGWYTKAVDGEVYDFATPVTGETTIYAHWTINSHTVEFVTLGGSAVASQTKDYGSKVDKPADPTRAGYDFGGWYKENDFKTAWSFNTDTVPDKDVQLYAKWDVKKYTVTFMDGDTVLTALTKSDVSHGTGISAPTEPTKDGYTFEGWLKSDNTVWTFGASGDKVTDNVTLTADWRENEYSVAYYVDGVVSTTTGNATTYKITNNTVDLGTLTQTGYTFDGWYDNAACTGTKLTALTFDLFEGATVENPVKLHARFTLNVYTVTYNLDGGANHASNPASYRITDGTNGTVTLQDPTKTDHTFKGWYTTSTFTESSKVTSLTHTGNDFTLFAKWEAVALEEHGIYIDGVRVKDCVENDSNSSEVMATNIVVKKDQIVRFRYGNAWIEVKSIGDNNDGNKFFGMENGRVKANTAGAYSFYLGKTTGTIWINSNSKYVECNVQEGDGIYLVGESTPLVVFVENQGTMNEISAKGVKVGVADEDTVYSVKLVYGGEDITVSQLDHPANVNATKDGVNIKLYAGEYNFYYCYGESGDGNPAGRLWVEGTQTGTAPTPTLEGNWYFACEDSGWGNATNKPEYKLSPNGEFIKSLKANVTFKILSDKVEWKGFECVGAETDYVKASGTNIMIKTDGKYKITFDGTSITVDRIGDYEGGGNEEPDPSGLQPSEDSIVIKCSDGSIKFTVVKTNGYVYGFDGINDYSLVFLHVWNKATDTAATGAWKNGKLNKTFETTLKMSQIDMVIVSETKNNKECKFTIDTTKLHDGVEIKLNGEGIKSYT